MSTAQQNGMAIVDQVTAAQQRLAALRLERSGINQDLVVLTTSLAALGEKIAANDAAQNLILDKLRTAGLALLGDTKLQAALQLPKPASCLQAQILFHNGA